MPVAKRKRAPITTKAAIHERNGRKRRSFRTLKAFGMWADRSDLKDPVLFTERLRSKTE